MAVKYRLWCRESERGWGSKLEHTDYDTLAKAQAAYDRINATLPEKTSNGSAPDYYYQAERIEVVDNTILQKYR